MEERKYSKVEIVNSLNQLGLSHLEKSLFGKLDYTNKEDNYSKEYLYLKGKNGKIFSRAETNSENSFFRYNTKNNEFEFYGDEGSAIANRIFSYDICNIVSGGYIRGNSVKTIKPGKIKYIDDKWEVVELVQIALEE